MSEKSEALRMADQLDRGWAYKDECSEIAAELRRLYASCEDYAQHKQRQDQRILTLTAQRDALLDALEEIHQATMKNKVVIAKYIGINFLAAIAIRKAKEGK